VLPFQPRRLLPTQRRHARPLKLRRRRERLVARPRDRLAVGSDRVSLVRPPLRLLHAVRTCCVPAAERRHPRRPTCLTPLPLGVASRASPLPLRSPPTVTSPW